MKYFVTICILLLMTGCVRAEPAPPAYIIEYIPISEPLPYYAEPEIEYKYEVDDDYEYEYEEYIFVPIFKREPLPEDIIDFITGVTFRDDTPFSYDFLTYLTITHVNFYGENRIGHMIVADEIGDEVLEIFREIYEAGFPIYSIRLIDYFDADDYLSLAANNSSAFNFRYIAGTNIISRHGFGMAIDINPIQNPYLRGDVLLPAAGYAYLDRDNVRPGMIVPGDVVYTAFISRGWTWGGNWTSLLDYHHFERRH
ncbi:MAG: M15 family metallopeptidase [Defluviitaleaceae bacterium]|nr:M15 family metallopeptidase [Defluviitaleaceae bacterium]